ncbi:uncharacterized protein LOC144153275 [Haemaphysalis longicornis]
MEIPGAADIPGLEVWLRPGVSLNGFNARGRINDDCATVKRAAVFPDADVYVDLILVEIAGAFRCDYVDVKVAACLAAYTLSKRSRTTYYVAGVLVVTLLISVAALFLLARKGAEPLTVCVFGAFLRIPESPPTGLCTFKVFAHVRVARHSEDFVGVDNQLSFDNYMKMASVGKDDNFLLSLSTESEFDESLEVQERATAILSRYRAQNIHGYGFARYRVAGAGVEIGKLWKHHKMLYNLRYWSTQPITLFLGLQIDHHRSYSEEYITGLVAEASASMDFVILVTHFTKAQNAASKNCQVELIGSWEPEAFNDKRLISTKEAASVVNYTFLDRGVKLPLLLSQSLAVVEYTVEQGLKVEEARLRNLKCSKAALVPFATVCNSTSTYIRGKHQTPTFCHYDDDPKNGRWRTYKTSLDMLKEIQSVAHALDPSTSNMFGWAFFDIDLEDCHGECAAYWGPGKNSGRKEAAAYYRLKVAATLAKADLRDKDAADVSNDPEYALVF